MRPPPEATPRRRVLIVSPHFAPTNAPDMQRTRLALPYLRSFGWEPVVLAIAPECIEGGVTEPLLEATFPADIRVVRARGWLPGSTRWAGFGSLWLRCGRALRAAGERLLREEKFDLVFISTTQFHAFSLGPRWRRRFGVPYVLDYQDPWVNDYYERTNTRPPGGPIKFALSQWSARRREPEALRSASGVIAVSEAYAATLARQYRWFDPSKVTVIPFGAAARDMAIARSHLPPKPVVDLRPGLFHHVYAGRCGPDMSTSLTALFRAFKIYLATRPEEAQLMRFHFIGTDYAPRPFGKEWAMPVARAEGVEHYVTEECYRVPYFDALHYLQRADAVVGVGSNDPTYSASKIYPYVLAARPMLLIFNKRSPVLAIAEKLQAGCRYSFAGEDDLAELAQTVADDWFLGGAMQVYHAHNAQAFRPYTAEGMTEQLARCFDAATGPGKD